MTLPSRMIRELRAFESLGVTEFAVAFGQTDAERVRDDMD